jgi:c-di-GMP-binding flagellar brake protein YcgR
VNMDSASERRKYLRAKLSVPIEFRRPGDQVSSRAATSDLSSGGFYLETMFTMPIGMELDVTLHLETLVPAVAVVATCDPSFGNGVRFVRMLPEDQAVLDAYVLEREKAEAASAGDCENSTQDA